MNMFLKAIGFDNITGLHEQDALLHDVLTKADFKKVVEDNGHTFVEISKEYAPDAGITVFGEYTDELFRMEYFYPYFWGSQVSSYEQIGVDRHIRGNSYAGVCDDKKIGTSLIFQVDNVCEYLDYRARKDKANAPSSVSLAGLSDTGAILFPVNEDRKPVPEDPAVVEKRDNLFNAARNGDEDAIESLTMEDMDTYNMLANRVHYEDVYSIVDSYFMPYGLECDLYNVMGDITDCNRVRNTYTGESFWQFSLVCNGIPVDISINEKNLAGIPEVGRRFKGIVWLQGRIIF